MPFPPHLEHPFLELHGVCQELQSKKLKHKKWPPGQMSVLRCFFLDFFQQIVHLNLVLFTYFDPILLLYIKDTLVVKHIQPALWGVPSVVQYGLEEHDGGQQHQKVLARFAAVFFSIVETS
jgi:hypothetical protein